LSERLLNAVASVCQSAVSRVTVAADSPCAEPKNCSSARAEIAAGQAVQIQQRQHLGHPRRFPRPRGQDRRGEPLPLTRRGVDALVVDPRLSDRHRARCRGHLPRLVVAVTDHQTATGLIDLVGELLDIGGDLGLQGGREHLPGAVTDDLIEQRRAARRAARRVGLGLVMNYLEHERTFPNRRANAGPDQTCYGLSDLPREGALLHVPAEGHPQVLIIALARLKECS
jgi:hypothetical protein